ncbi:uncharacterized protein LOC111085511 [Limulus polyphemus]|uniref:Uncharacterized protein LOC111085511 n=1 Tax=Limulus polyphemus TaxID=6850 RepID=A0ABM1S922_LIMPO|nr:uncharacterized protein LOC111085511 [Limulus polyphemus]XP_022240128.1 uncharacterized protein LOC111085511 [Limulus polyphemus]
MISSTKLATGLGLCLVFWHCVTCFPNGDRPLNDLSSRSIPFQDEFQRFPDKPELYQLRRRMKQETKRTAAMGVDLPDYILHFKGNWPDLSIFRDRMQQSGKR